MKTWKQLKQKLLKDPKVASEYKRLTPQYQLISQLIQKRREKGFTQAQLAKAIGTKQSAIARIESGNANISVGLLGKITQALDSHLIIQIR